jgi:signal transduction histidine kinase
MSQGRFAVKCDASGRVFEVIRDDLSIVGTDRVGAMLPTLGTPDGSIRCFEMLDALRSESAIFGWLVELEAAEGPVGLHFAGVQRGGEVLLVASEDLADVQPFADELQRVNNEHVTRLRELVKERAKFIDAQSVYPQMTDLNNANTALEREVMRQKKELERLLLAKNELLGMAAHDLRNPLTVIAGLLEVLRLEDAVDGGHQELLEEIESAITMMTRILEGVLDVSAIESGVLKLDVRVCDLETLVGRAVALHVLSGRRVGVGIDLRSSGALRVSADEVKLHQVLNNLIANSIEHSPRGSTVKVELHREDDAAVLSVVDEGVGIPEDQRSAVFEAFHRGEEGDSRGTGLGLAIARRIAQGHGGSLDLVSREGRGCHFELRLPLPPKR